MFVLTDTPLLFLTKTPNVTYRLFRTNLSTTYMVVKTLPVTSFIGIMNEKQLCLISGI